MILKVLLHLVFVGLAVSFGGMVRSKYPDFPTTTILAHYFWVPLVMALVHEAIMVHLDLPDDAM